MMLQVKAVGMTSYVKSVSEKCKENMKIRPPVLSSPVRDRRSQRIDERTITQLVYHVGDLDHVGIVAGDQDRDPGFVDNIT